MSEEDNLGIIIVLMKYAIYDFDGTLLQAQTVPMILKHWEKSNLPQTQFKKVKRRIITKYILQKLKIFGIQRERFRYWAMEQVGQLFGSISFDQLSVFLDSLYEESKKSLHKKLVKQIQKDKLDGYTTILLSGNFDVFLERYRSLGFDFVLGTVLFNPDGKVKSKIEILSAKHKVPAIQKQFKVFMWDKTKAYSDAFADLELLKKAKEAICVTPDRRLTAYAKANQWRIIL